MRVQKHPWGCGLEKGRAKASVGRAQRPAWILLPTERAKLLGQRQQTLLTPGHREYPCGQRKGGLPPQGKDWEMFSSTRPTKGTRQSVAAMGGRAG